MHLIVHLNSSFPFVAFDRIESRRLEVTKLGASCPQCLGATMRDIHTREIIGLMQAKGPPQQPKGLKQCSLGGNLY